MGAKPFVTGYQGYFNPGIETVIAQGAQESAPINTGGMVLAGIILPSVFTGTALTFTVGDSADGYQARGQITFTGVPADADTVEINGVTITFVEEDPGDNEVLIGDTAAETAANLQTFLDDTEDEDLLACTYETSGAVVQVVAVEHGTAGNAFTFDKSGANISVVPSGGTLAGGGFRALYDASNALVSMTVAQNRAYAVDPKNFQGVYFLKVKSGSAEVAARTLILSLKGI